MLFVASLLSPLLAVDTREKIFQKNKAFLNLSSINLPYTDIVSCEGGFFSFPEAACISRLAR